MSLDHIRYDLLTQEAMRGVVRSVLKDAAAHGLPGEHHFFVTFDTRSPGVKLSTRMRAQYPQDMTIVLQHQFWDLKITDDVLEVGLSFNGIPEKLAIPIAAIKSFVDPSVKFGVQFTDATEPVTEAPAEKTGPTAVLTAVPQKAKQEAGEAKSDQNKPDSKPGAEKPSAEKSGTEKPSAEVVSFDRFRKK